VRWRSAEDEGSASTGQGALFDEAVDRHVGHGEFRGMEFLHVNAQRIINEVPKSTPLPFRYTINAYRGCSHACTFCFARPTHEYLDLNAGVDFERKIVVKVNAVERLRAELAPARWAGDPIAMGTNTDPYQRCEGKYRITRGIVETLAAARNPFSILTKSTLILRDLDVLADAARHVDVRANLSIGTLDDDVWRATEPGTPHPRKRVEAVARLNAAGIPTGVLVAPVIPGMSDGRAQVQEVVDACADAGAVSITAVLLHLRPGVRELWFDWLRATRPDLVAHHEQLYPGAYAPRARRQELGRLVHARLARTRGPLATRDAAHDRDERAAATSMRPPAPRQLPLL
jgi:DNA repair photolyase